MSARVNVIDARKTWRRGGVPALRGVSLEVPAGAIAGLVGPNGAGKSTLLGALLGFVRLDAGRAEVGGHRAGTLPALRLMGYCPQSLPAEPGLSGRRMLEELHALSGRPRERRARDVDAVLDAIGLDARAAGRLVSDYSLGMRRRLSIAQAFLGDPAVVVLDEPTAGLDPPAVARLRALMRSARARGSAVLMSSHHLDEVARACDGVTFLRRGRSLAGVPGDPAFLERLFLEDEGAS